MLAASLLSAADQRLLPLPILQTDHGSLLYTTSDLNEQLTSEFIVQLELSDLIPLGKKSVPLYEMCQQLPKRAILSIRNLENGLAESTNTGAQVLTSNGKLGVSLDDYMGYIRKHRPAAFIAMADEVGSHCGKNRREKAQKRTISWLETQVALRDELGCMIFAVCVGGNQLQARKACAEQLSRYRVDGVVVGELFCGESAEDRQQCIQIVREIVGPEMLIMAQGAMTPIEVLGLIRCGVSWIASNYPSTLTKQGLAICWDLVAMHRERSKRKKVASEDGGRKRQRGREGVRVELRDSQDGKSSEEPQSMVMVLNLYDRQHEMASTQPLMHGCQCHTCRRPHSRAYIHHLLRAHELTGDILLYQHNQWQWLQLFDTIRSHKQANTFEDFAVEMSSFVV